ncbi:MAG TPA: A24 family peptidase [Anaerolineales bacterium]|nr:A24 family peptidase [Anaerolineales bacterium]
MILVAALAGFVSGVVLNALADSLPYARTVRMPGCIFCGAPRPRLAWSGLSAEVAGKRRCPYCDSPHGIRRPIVESLAAAWGAGLTLIVPEPRLYWPAFLLSMISLLIIVIDLEHRLILHVVTGPAALVMALIGSLDASRGPVKTLAGGAVGFLAVLGLYVLGGLFARLIYRLRGRALEEVAFGFGDVTLAGVIGLSVGFPGIVVALTLGVLAGGVFSLGFLLVMIARGRYVAFMPIPYSPFLVVGALVVFIGARSGLFS